MVSPRTVMRAENARFTSRNTQSEGPTICSMPTRSGSVSVICVSSVEMGSLLMEAPFDVHLQNGFIVSKPIETLVKGASKQDGWFVATRYAKGAACVFDEAQVRTTRAFRTWSFPVTQAIPESTFKAPLA